MRSTLAAVVAAFVLFLGTAHGAVLCVNPGGTGGCFAAIQAAIDATAPDDQIDVAAGVYVEDLNIPSDRQQVIAGAGPGSTTIQGGILASQAYLDLKGVTVDGAGGGGTGIYLNFGDTLILTDCVISGHSSGIFGYRPSRVILTDSTVRDNTSIGVLLQGDTGVLAQLKLYRSTISGNGGGGIRMKNAASIARIDDSTISGNGAPGFEAIGAGRPRLLLRRSTISGNARGIVDSTIAGGRLNARLDRTIVADSTDGPDVIGHADTKLRSRGYSLIETLDPSTTLNGAGPDLLGVDPLLGPLQSNGGPTETQAPLAGSPVIDFIGKTARCRQPDQRGASRLPAPCDIGSYATP
jgi:hypothetical protein